MNGHLGWVVRPKDLFDIGCDYNSIEAGSESLIESMAVEGAPQEGTKVLPGEPLRPTA